MSDFERKAEQQWRAHMISQLKDAVRDLEIVKAENAKLREENRRIGLITYELGRKSLAEENAKLRALVSDMWREFPKTDCGWDTSANLCTEYDECHGECGFWYRMRELGIEIER